MPDADLFIMFAGSGASTPANVKSLLDDQLIGERDVSEFYVPDQIAEKTQPGLANVVGYLTKYWGDEESQEDAFKTAPLNEFEGLLLKARELGQEPVLVILAGDEGADDETADLVEAALAVDVTVKDLSAGLEVIEATEEEAEVVPAEPEPVAETPKRRRRTEITPVKEEPAEAVSGTDKPKRTRGTPRTPVEVQDIGTKALDDLKVVREAAEDKPPFDGPYVQDDRPKGINFSKLLREPESDAKGLSVSPDGSLRELLIVALRGALSALEGTEGLGAVLDGASAPAEGPTTAYIRDDSTGELRKRGRGKPKTGETAVYLTPKQEKELGLK